MAAASYPAVRAALEAQWTRLIEGFAAADPDQPSRIVGWSVADLERHVSQTGESLGRLAAEPPAKGALTGLGSWTQALAGLRAQTAGDVRNDPAPALAIVAPAALSALDGADPDKPVRQRTGVHRLADAALFRLIEGVVHGLDLPDPLLPDRSARRIVVRALAGLLASLAPGRSVELRIPPDAAIQLIEGPRHTRGTPSGVVETDPASFLRLATGRMTWSGGVEHGLVRASGKRTDLSEYLPLLA